MTAQEFPAPPPGFGLGPEQPPAGVPSPAPATDGAAAGEHTHATGRPAGAAASAEAGAQAAVVPTAATAPTASAVQTWNVAPEHGGYHPGQALAACLRRYVSFRGRAGRSEFWWMVCCTYALLWLAAVVDARLGYQDFATTAAGQSQPNGPAATLVSFVLMLPMCAVFARRLHDVGRSGWSWLWGLTIIGLLPLLLWLCRSSGPNVDNGRGLRP